jgi:hypothetical protein
MGVGGPLDERGDVAQLAVGEPAGRAVRDRPGRSGEHKRDGVVPGRHLDRGQTRQVVAIELDALDAAGQRGGDRGDPSDHGGTAMRAAGLT